MKIQALRAVVGVTSKTIGESSESLRRDLSAAAAESREDESSLKREWKQRMKQPGRTDDRATLVIHQPERLGRSPRGPKLVRNEPPRLPRKAILVARAVLFALRSLLLAAVVDPVGIVRGEVALVGGRFPEVAGEGGVPGWGEGRRAMERVAVVAVDHPERVVVPVCTLRLATSSRLSEEKRERTRWARRRQTCSGR
jgi:hypothetical protein